MDLRTRMFYLDLELPNGKGDIIAENGPLKFKSWFLICQSCIPGVAQVTCFLLHHHCISWCTMISWVNETGLKYQLLDPSRNLRTSKLMYG